MSNATLFLLSMVSSEDAIGWHGKALDVPHHTHPSSCIHPPPFGQQCTLHYADALLECLTLERCRAFTCPSPGPYRRGGRKDGIRGPICQLRSISMTRWERGERREAKHGMCRSRGQPEPCSNFFLSPTTAEEMQMSGQMRAALQAAWQYRSEGAVRVAVRKNSAIRGSITVTTARNLGLHRLLADDGHYAIYTVSRGRQRQGEGGTTPRFSDTKDAQKAVIVRRRRAQRRQLLHTTPSTSPTTEPAPHDPCMNIHSFMCRRKKSRK
jgi:hypothetical protein